jgi:hypothetical protein
MLKFKQTAWVLVGLFLPLTACVSQTRSVTSAPPAADTQIAQRPETRTTTLSVEGERTQVALRLLDEAALPFTTYVPEGDFIEEVAASDEGVGVRFYFSPTGEPDEAAYVHLFFPYNAPDSTTLREELLGEQGLLATNGWRVLDRATAGIYPWAKERITYEQTTPEDIFTGSVFVGEHAGAAFLALTHYPVEYGDGFEPRAAIILENMEFR